MQQSCKASCYHKSGSDSVSSTSCTAEQQHRTSQSSATVTSTLCIVCVWNSLWSSLKLKPSPYIDLLSPQNVPFGKAGPETNPIIGVIKMFAITRCPRGVIASNCNKRGGQLFFFGLRDWWRTSGTWQNPLFVPIWIHQRAALTPGQWLHCVPITH